VAGPRALTALILTGTILNVVFLTLAAHQIDATLEEITSEIQRHACRHANPELEDWSESDYCNN
jgi:hypothetical protein